MPSFGHSGVGTNGEGVGTGVGGGRPGVMDGVDVGGGGPAHTPAVQTASAAATILPSKHAVPAAVACSGNAPVAGPYQHCLKDAVHGLTATPSAVKLTRSADSRASAPHKIALGPLQGFVAVGVADTDAPNEGVGDALRDANAAQLTASAHAR